MSSQHTNTNDQLSWRIPIEGRSELRTNVLRVAFAGLMCLGVVLLFGARSFRIAALVGAIPFTLFVLWRSRRRSGRQDSGDNVRLDNAGLHWLDSQGVERKIAREQIESFRIGLDPDTLRALPALTLIFAGGFESQPVELHAPAAPSHVRQFLTGQMQVDESPQDGDFADCLQDALAVACDNKPHLPEMRLLRFGLMEPEQMPAGSWLVARLSDGHRVEFLPDTCRFRCSGDGLAVELDDLEQLADFIRLEILAEHGNQASQWLSTLDQQQAERVQLAIRSDASRLGFYVECDPHGRLHFEGSRRGILELCQRIASAAERLREAPFGGRQPTINVGGSAVRLEVMLDSTPWSDEATLAGPRGYLREVTEQLRLQVENQVTADLVVKVKHGKFPAQLFGVHLRGDVYDPLSKLAPRLEVESSA